MTELTILRLITGRVFPVLTRGVCSLLPPRLWFSAALRLTGALTPLNGLRRKPRRDYALNRAWMLNRFLRLLTESGHSFPIPYTIEGQEALRQMGAEPGLLYCTGHLPLINLVAASVDDLGLPVPASIQARCPPNGKAGIFGHSHAFSDCITVNHLSLIKARQALATGTLLTMIDTAPGSPYSKNLLRLLPRIGARMMLVFTELHATGSITVSFVAAPYPFCRTEEEIDANLEALDKHLKRIRREEEPVRPLSGVFSQGVPE